eukprot:8854813-Pyramimonas_sp.AAC.1
MSAKNRATSRLRRSLARRQEASSELALPTSSALPMSFRALMSSVGSNSHPLSHVGECRVPQQNAFGYAQLV